MEEVLMRAGIGRIALCDGAMPYIVPVNFVYHEGKIAFHCAWEGTKLDLIAKNPHCCFEVDLFRGDVRDHYEARCHLDYDSVLTFGKARIGKDDDEKVRLLQLFAEKYDERYRSPVSEGGKKFGKERASECCCVIIDIENLTGRRERTVEGKRKKALWRHRL
jgi:nitroimidazol reductase NimA-like FMN-containing flavoprotein (pyridoxamine 5'-phosphate oxidase superfamily)